MAENKNTQVATQTQDKQVERREPVRYNTDFSLGIFGSSDNFMMATQMAKAFASSTIVPKDYQGNYANGLVAIDLANRLKISPLAVMQNLDVIQGRPAWRATFLIGLINGSGKYDFELQFDEKEKNGKPFSCTCWTEKDGRKVTGITVDMDMAEKEGWTKKNGSKWITMPQVMLRYRAASFFSRMNCPEISNGIYTKEEVIDMGDNTFDIEAQVRHDIESHANQQEFVIDEPPAIEEKSEPKTVSDVTAGAKEKEAVGKDMNVPAKDKKQDVPSFMRMEDM